MAEMASSPHPADNEMAIDDAHQPRRSAVESFRSASMDLLLQHQTHHLIPHSSKVVVFDSRLPVHHALVGLVTHDINCAPVWDSARRKYTGMLSVSDFLDVLLWTYHSGDEQAMAALTAQKLCDWTEQKIRRGNSINRLLSISPESTLHEAVRQLLKYRVHRLCIIQLALPDTILRILTNHTILRFLRANTPALHTVTCRDLGIGVFRHLLTLSYDTPLIRALEMLSNYKVSSIPVVDSNGRPIDVYSRSDVRFLAMDHTWTDLNVPISQSLAPHQSKRILPLCTRDDTLFTLSGLLVSTQKHSLICVDPISGVIEGVVSLTDIFSFILHTGPPNSESRIAALRADLDEMSHQQILPETSLQQQQQQQQQHPPLTSLLLTSTNKPILNNNNNNNNNEMMDDDTVMHGSSISNEQRTSTTTAAVAANTTTNNNHGDEVGGETSLDEIQDDEDLHL